MKKSRVIAAVLAAAVLSAGTLAAASAAESGQSAAENTDETEYAMTEPSSEADLLAAGSQTAGVRPSYRASDYVKINDDKYRNMTFRLYPPADSSDQAQAEYKKQLDTDIMTQLYSLYPVDSYPQDLENYVIGSLTDTYRQYAEMYGMDVDTFLSTYLGADQKTFSGQVREAAEKTLKQELLLTAVAEKENIQVTDDEYQKGLSDYASKYGYASTDALLADFDEATVRVSLLMDKTLDFLEKQSKVEQIIETESESLTESETAAAGQTAETPAGQVSGTAAAAHTAETQTSETVKQ